LASILSAWLCRIFKTNKEGLSVTTDLPNTQAHLKRRPS
jgi:hypothetical protein